MIYIIGVVVNFFLTFLLLGKKNKNTSDKILLIWFFIIGIHLLIFYLNYSLIIIKYPHLLGVGIIFPFLHGPFLYLYTLNLTSQKKFSKNQLMHFIPAMLVVVVFLDFFILDGSAKLKVYEEKGLGFQTRFQINYAFMKISGLVYIVWSQFLLFKHKKNIVDKFSNIEKINLYWLQYIIAGVALVWVFVLFGGNVNYLYLTVVIFVIFMGYFGINQVGIFNTQTISQKSEDAQKNKEPEIISDVTIKYKKSGLDELKADEIYHHLKERINKDEVFLNPDLNLTELAQILDVHPNHLSQVINSYEGKNFYDYINEKRIEKFISLVMKPENKKYTLLSLAYDCGFNSKSAFNRQFKKVTNKTPTDFINSI